VSAPPSTIGGRWRFGRLAALPLQLRKAMMHCSFNCGLGSASNRRPLNVGTVGDREFMQVGSARVPMTAIGVDVAQGADDMTVIAARHGF
jgi:hypothetical protein